MILIAGGTGRLGTLVVRRLAERGLPVRVLTRDAARAQHLTGVEVAVGDVRDRSSLGRAMDRVTNVVSAVHGFEGPGGVTPKSVDRDGNANLVDAAAVVGADVVLMSVVGASPDSPMALFRAKYAAEQHLRASGASWTIVRATAFVEMWAEIMRKPIVFGRGDNPINFVSVHDVAAVVERAVTDAGLRGRTLDVGGPENLTFNQLIAELQAARGATAKIRHIPRGILRVMAPLSRRAAAAVAMDTVDLTFDASGSGAVAGRPVIDSRTALAMTVR